MPGVACTGHPPVPLPTSPPGVHEAEVDTVCMLTASLLKPQAFLPLRPRNNFLWHQRGSYSTCLGQLRSAGDLPLPDKSSFLIHGGGGAFPGTFYTVPQRAPAPQSPTDAASLALPHLTVSTPCANKPSVPKSLSRVLLLWTLKL